MAQTTETNFHLFYNRSPNVIIKDNRGFYYNFPSNYYNNGNGGEACSESDSGNYANGRKWAGFRDQLPWTETWMVNINTYGMRTDVNSNGSSVSNEKNDNAYNADTLKTLADNALDNLPGYTRVSSGDYSNRNSRNYIVADTGGGSRNFSFAVYTKKNALAFFEILLR